MKPKKSSYQLLQTLSLPGWRKNYRRATTLAKQWAAENPKMRGYIVVTDHGPDDIWIDGGAFYQVQDGKAQGISAIDVR